MSISTVDAGIQEKSLITSTANQVNPKTTAKRKINKKGEIVTVAHFMQPKIKDGIHVFSNKEQLLGNKSRGIQLIIL